MGKLDDKKLLAEFDIAETGDKDMAGAYAPGTMVDIGGKQVDLSTVPDVFASGSKAAAPKT